MAKFFTLTTCLVAAFISQCTGHFLLNYPPGIGFDDDLEGNAPCGGFKVDFTKDNITDFHIDGDVIALQSTHPQDTWLFRATLDTTASGNWTQLLPTILQSGLGAFCEPSVAIPASFVGSKGVIQIVADAPDGLLYQCAAVNFVAGTGSTQSVCTNVTGLQASFTADTALSSIPASATATSTSASSSGSSATTTPSSSSTAKPSAATNIYQYSGFGMTAWVMAVGSATFLACFW